MATKILVGLVVALLGTGLGVYVAFRDTGSCHAGAAPSAIPVSEGGCCAQANSCCDDEPRAACCEDGAVVPTSDALAACTGGAAFGSVTAAPAKKKVRVGHTSVE